MTIAALLAFGALVAAWLAAPADRRRRVRQSSPAMPDLASEAQPA
jgi:hypothetical protein